MTLIKYILKNDSINFKFLFKSLKKNLLTIVIITSTLFVLSSLYSYKKISQQINLKIYFVVKNDINILNEKYRTAMSNNSKFRQFIGIFVNDFYESYYIILSENNLKDYNFIESAHNVGSNYFSFKLNLNSWNVITMEQINIIRNEIELSFYETLYEEAKKYSSAVDINYKTLSDSISLKKIEILQFNKINFILTLISNLIISLIISFLYILFKKVR